MKRIALVVAVALLGLLVWVNVSADDGSMFNWYDECGYTCYQWADGSGDCYPCLKCEECDECKVPTPEPTRVPETPTPDPDPTPIAKESCNRGIGNGSEDCDPGNSGGKPGAAGEDNE